MSKTILNIVLSFLTLLASLTATSAVAQIAFPNITITELNGQQVYQGGSDYDQIDYEGFSSQYSFFRNADRSVSVTKPDGVTDRLIDIDGFWFAGEEEWYSVENVLTTATGNQTITGTADDYDQVDYSGRSTDYTFVRNSDVSVSVTKPGGFIDQLINIDGFWFTDEAQWYPIGDLVGPISGNQTYTGTAEYDQVDYPGAATDYTFVLSNGSVTVSKPDGTTDTLIDIDGIWFQGEEAWYSMETLTISPGADRTITGTEVYDQVDYEGALTDYVFVENTNSSVSVTRPDGGTDTLTSIDGFWFSGEEAWYSIEAALIETGSNEAPTISGAAGDAIVGQAFSFLPTASDPDGDTLSFSSDNLPNWLTLNVNTGAVTGTPISANVGQEDFVITVSDGRVDTPLSVSFAIIQTTSTTNNCRQMNFVAHQDDDFLFINPAMQRAIDNGCDVQSVFLTNGADHAREDGIKRAYARMAGVTGAQQQWNDSQQVYAGKSVLSSDLAGTNVSVRFMRLPQGGVRSVGSQLVSLWDGAIATTSSTDPTPVQYTKTELKNTLAAIIETFDPGEINTLNPDTVPFAEHPDHIYVARMVREVVTEFNFDAIPVNYHLTYPSAERRANISKYEVSQKRESAAAYFGVASSLLGRVFAGASWNASWIPRTYSYTQSDTTNGLPTAQSISLQNLQEGTCPRNSTSLAVGNTISMGNCDNNPDWELVPVLPFSSYGGQIRSVNGLCLERRDDTLIANTCSQITAQQWRPLDFGRIYAYDSSQCLTSSGGLLRAVSCGGSVGPISKWLFDSTNRFNSPDWELAIPGNFDTSNNVNSELLYMHRRENDPGFDLWVSKDQLVENWYTESTTFDVNSTHQCGFTLRYCFDLVTPVVGDYNGDGASDVLLAMPTSATNGVDVDVLLSNGSSAFGAPSNWGEFNGLWHDRSRFTSADLNNDLFDDLIIMQKRGDAGYNLLVSFSNGTTFSAPVLAATNLTGGFDNARIMPFNFDNNGRDDVLITYPDTSDRININIYSFNDEGVGSLSQSTVFNSFNNKHSKIRKIDIDRDQDDDLIIFHRRGTDGRFNIWSVANDAGTFSSVFRLSSPSDILYTESTPVIGDFNSDDWEDVGFIERIPSDGAFYLWQGGTVKLTVSNNTAGVLGTPTTILDLPDFTRDSLRWWSGPLGSP